jgi:hypothetical protein
MIQKSIEKFPDGSSKSSYVECGICGYRSSDLAQHPQIHGISQQQYRENYGQIKCEDLKNKIKGKNNPAHNHGGRLSPFSKKFINYKSDDYIEQVKQKAVQTKVKNNTNPLTTSYYIKKGFTEEESKKKLSERQSTFSLKKCIEKHGLEKGTEIWSKRQQKWLNTLNSKTSEELAEINKKKIYKNGISSKQELQLFEELNSFVNFNLENQHIIERDDIPGRYYSYDIRYKNKIIEYNGDLWHANPSKYKKTDIPKIPKNKKTAEEIWNRDRLKNELVKNKGYDVLVIWESDYKNDKQKVIEKCIKFLTQ